MHTYFEVKTQYSKIGEDGNPKKVSESFLADAISCTDAELIVTKEVSPFSNGEFKIKNIRETTIAELFNRDLEGKWYACRLHALSIDEKGNEKKFPVLIYVKATEVKDAEAFVMLQLKKSVQEWVIVSVTETKIIDVFTK